ncbi:MAG: hypothetical protein E4G96_03835, partial [Chrysiogenales bacterium]
MNPLSFFSSLFTLQKGDFFETHFSVELLKSERIRCLMLIGIFAATSAWFFVLYLFIPGIMPENAFRPYYGVPITLWVCVILIASALYELLFYILIGILIKNNLRLPTPPRLANAFIETSIPTILIFFAAHTLYSHEALLLPTSYLYFVFIALSALRLSFLISLYTGLIASVEYIMLALYLIPAQVEAVHDGVLFAPGIHLAKGLLLLLSGIITGFAAHQIRLRVGRSIKATEDRNRIVGIFGQHVSPEVVNRLLNQKEDLAGEIRFVCMMFLDIRNFTRFTAGKNPQEVIHYLNYLFGFM